MNRTTLLVVMMAGSAAVILAQEPAPTPLAEFGLNASLLNSHPGNDVQSFSAPGGSATVVYNFSRAFGAVADLGGYHNGADVNFNPTTFTYLFGPRISLRHSRLTPYAQALFGGARQWTSFADPVSGLTSPPNSGFAAAYGGGLDIRVKDHLLIKPFQVDYLMTRVVNPLSTTNNQNNIRFSAGVVFTIGSK